MRRLKDLVISKVSLVSSPATGFKFLVVKHKGGLALKDALKKLLGKFCSEDDLKGIEDIEVSEEVQTSVEVALAKAAEYEDSLPQDVLSHFGKMSLGTLLQAATVTKSKDGDGEESGEEGDEGDGKDKPVDKGKVKTDKPDPVTSELISKVEALGEKLDRMNNDLDEAFGVHDDRLVEFEKALGRGVSKQTSQDGDENGDVTKNEAPKWPSWSARS